MIDLTDFTDPADVRAVLGVSDEELEDTTIVLPLYAMGLQERLYDVNSNIVTAYLPLLVLPTPTNDQAHFVDLVQTYSTYVVAQLMLGSVKMFAPKTITDSKAEADRIDDPFADLRNEILAGLNYMSSRVLAAYLVLYPGAVVAAPVKRVMMASVGLGFDPVTNT